MNIQFISDRNVFIFWNIYFRFQPLNPKQVNKTKQKKGKGKANQQNVWAAEAECENKNLRGPFPKQQNKQKLLTH